MARGVGWRPTLRTVGIWAAVVGAVALVAPFAWRASARWPTPIATIDEPAAGAALDDCFVAKGRILPSTIRKPMWLIKAWDGSGWRPEKKIDPSSGVWEAQPCVHGRTGDQYRLALVVVDRERDEVFQKALENPPEDEIPGWLRRLYRGERCPGRRHRRAGIDPLPDGVRLIASTTAKVVDGDADLPTCGAGPADARPVRWISAVP